MTTTTTVTAEDRIRANEMFERANDLDAYRSTLPAASDFESMYELEELRAEAEALRAEGRRLYPMMQLLADIAAEKVALNPEPALAPAPREPIPYTNRVFFIA